jgi:hypothetical protein
MITDFQKQIDAQAATIAKQAADIEKIKRTVDK